MYTVSYTLPSNIHKVHTWTAITLDKAAQIANTILRIGGFVSITDRNGDYIFNWRSV